MLNLFKENVKIAIGSVRTQLLRTILTVLIIAIGITALVGILTVVAALENTISADFASMGANTFNINQYENTTRNRGNDEREVINMLDGTELDRIVAKHQPDLIVPEIEAIRTEHFYDYEKSGMQVVLHLAPCLPMVAYQG